MSIDQSVVDLDIPFRLGGFASTTTQLLGVCAVMTQVTWQTCSLCPMAIACLWDAGEHNLLKESPFEQKNFQVIAVFYL